LADSGIDAGSAQYGRFHIIGKPMIRQSAYAPAGCRYDRKLNPNIAHISHGKAGPMKAA
jgi:hypothetical protein